MDESWTHLDAGFDEVEFEREGLAHEDVGVVRVLEGLLELLELPPREVGARAPPLRRRRVLVQVLLARVCGKRKINVLKFRCDHQRNVVCACVDACCL